MSARPRNVLFAVVLSLTSTVAFAQNNWQGCYGCNWSNSGNWSLGLPGPGSDVVIYTGGPDLVYLDTAGLAQSLTLGGAANGTQSQLTDNGAPQTLTIANSLVVGQTGFLNLYGGTAVSAGADSINAGTIHLINGSSLSITGNLDNVNYYDSNGGSLNVTGTLTNGSFFSVDGSGDTANVGVIANNAYVFMGQNASLNLTKQPGGITDIVAGSSFWIQGTVTDVMNSANGFANVQSIEGQLFLQNGQTTSITPGNGTLVVSNSGWLDVSTLNGTGTTLTVNGNLDNSQLVLTSNFENFYGYYGGGNTLNVTGTFTNRYGAVLYMHGNYFYPDVVNVGTLNNLGNVFVAQNSFLNLTNQPGGITDVVGNFLIQGTVTDVKNAANGFAIVQNIEGQLFLQNGQVTSITPGNGTLNNTGWLDVSTQTGLGTTVNVNGNLDSSLAVTTGNFESFNGNYGGGNILNVSCTFTNDFGASLYLHGNYYYPDVVNVASIVNKYYAFVGPNAFLNLTNEPGGITDILPNATYQIQGTVTDVMNSANGFANLQSMEGKLAMQNGQTTSITPGNGTLSMAAGSQLDVSALNGIGSTVNINGNVDNFGVVTTSYYGIFNMSYGGGNTLSVSGAFTNEYNAQLNMQGNYSNPDTVNLGSLNNLGGVYVGPNVFMNLTNQPAGITDVVAGSQFTIVGTFTNQLTSSSAFAGLTSVEGGLQLQNGQTTTITPAGGTFTVSPSGYVEVSNGSTMQINGDAINNATLVAANGGTVQVNGNVANTGYAGTPSWISGGGSRFNVTGTLNNQGYFPLNNPGDSAMIGNLVNQNAVYVGPGATLDPMRVDNYSWIGVNGTMIVGAGTPSGPGYYQFANGTLGEHISMSQFGVVTVGANGAVNLNGTLDIQLATGFEPSIGSSYGFIYFTPGDLTGTFSSILNDVFNNGTERWVVIYSNSGGYVALEAAPVPEPSSILLVGTGLLGLSYSIRRRLSR